MGSITVRVDGLKELQKAMQSLGRKTSNRIAVKAMRKGGAIVRDKARMLAPVLKESVPHRRAGTLRKSIQSRTKVGKSGRTDTYIWVKGLSIKQVLKFPVAFGVGALFLWADSGNKQGFSGDCVSISKHLAKFSAGGRRS